jgi:hypothetical protein
MSISDYMVRKKDAALKNQFYGVINLLMLFTFGLKYDAHG